LIKITLFSAEYKVLTVVFVVVRLSNMSSLSSPDKKAFEASDLGEMLIDAVARDDKKVAKTALKSGICC